MNVLSTITALLCGISMPIAASVQETEQPKEPAQPAISKSDTPSVCLFTQFEFTLKVTTNKYIETTLKNSFTLLPSKVKVELYLYSSATQTTDISKMTCDGATICEDLNMGESISVKAYYRGEERYWLGYAIYHDSTDTVYSTPLYLVHADGTATLVP